MKDTRVLFLEAVHTSRKGISDANRTLCGSFLIDSPEGRVYFAGDTAYGSHFKRIHEEFGAPLVSLLPTGASEPRWFMYRMHMNPNEAVLAHRDLHSQHSIAIHFGLLDMAGESYEAPVNDLAIARDSMGSMRISSSLLILEKSSVLTGARPGANSSDRVLKLRGVCSVVASNEHVRPPFPRSRDGLTRRGRLCSRRR